MFGQVAVTETPATDPKTLIGRNVYASVSDILGDRSKDAMQAVMKIERVEGRNAYTRFNGIVTIREHIARFVRKRSQKVESVEDFETKDGWKLRFKSVMVLNRNVNASVKKNARAHIRKELEKTVPVSTIDGIAKLIVSGKLQNSIRKSGNRIYPVRFFEISKLEVLKAPAS